MKEYVHVTNELVEFRKDFEGQHGDFSGREFSFTTEERIRFLSAYSDFQRKINGLGEKSEKAVSAERVKERLAKIDYPILPKLRIREELGDFDASLLPKRPVYEGWQFYTERTALDGGAVCFTDGEISPIPCAKYEFDGETLRSIRLKVYVSGEYKKERVALSEKNVPHTITTGRTIELRRGIEEILKIQFYAVGVVCARVGVPDIYHHKNVIVGNYRFDEWNDIAIEFNGDTYSIDCNGKRTEGLPLTTSFAPDTLFLSGGFHPRGVWKVKPERFVFAEREQTAFFLSTKPLETTEEKLGKVDLPYVVGGYKNKDKYLILRKEIGKREGKRAILTLDSLDPGGRVYLNGEMIFKTDSFMRESVDITERLTDGKNLLTILIEPRAPEILYPWHRSKDSYMGWFSNAVTLEYYGKTHIRSVDVITNEIAKDRAEVTLRYAAEQAEGKTLKIYVGKTNPTVEEEKLVYVGVAKTEERLALSLTVDAWSPENPALYCVRVEIEGQDDHAIETGFRTIRQSNGALYLNNEKFVARGALLMQFLPPYENIVTSHVCPTNEELVWQFELIKNMNGNLARLHMLGYGTNDERYARFCDRLGLTLIWTTRFIDSIESVQWGDGWAQGDCYVRQMEEVKQHPSIIIWEGSNEYRAVGEDIDWLYDEFVSKVKKADDTRLLSPCSHLYYGGGLSGEGAFYQDDGEFDQDFQPAHASFGWRDESVIRSAHPYCITLGYGSTWENLRSEPWKAHQSLFDSKNHAYLVTEMATIGRHDDTTPECKAYVKSDSYEVGEERHTIGRMLDQSEWRISQAYQALAASKAIQFLRVKGADGLAWCCLTGGANDASYFKPPVDFYGYAKYAYYAMKENYAETLVFNENTDVRYGKYSVLKPCLIGAKNGETYDICVCVYDGEDRLVDEIVYENVRGDKDKLSLGEWKPDWEKDGYYRICYTLSKK